MRNIEEQLAEIEKRSSSIKQARSHKKAALGVFMCITIIAALSSYIVSIPMGNQEFGENIMFGSLVLSSPFLGYFVTGFISFLLGISFTMLCLHVQKRNRR